MVTLVETSADILAVGEIIDTKVDSRRLGNGLRADMFSSMLAPIFGSFTQSAFAQNVGLVAVTGIKSRYVVATGGLFLVILGLLPVMGRVIAAVPTAVLGGAGIVLFGTVAASGIRTLSKVDYRNNMNLIIVATSIGFGMIPIAAPTFYDHFPSWFATIFHSGISSSAIMAILLNLAFNHFTAGNSDQQSVFVAASERTLRYQDIAALHEGDYFLDGKLYDAQGEVPLAGDDSHGAPPRRAAKPLKPAAPERRRDERPLLARAVFVALQNSALPRSRRWSTSHLPWAMEARWAFSRSARKAKRTGRAMRLLVWPSGSVMWQPPAQGRGNARMLDDVGGDGRLRCWQCRLAMACSSLSEADPATCATPVVATEEPRGGEVFPACPYLYSRSSPSRRESRRRARSAALATAEHALQGAVAADPLVIAGGERMEQHHRGAQHTRGERRRRASNASHSGSRFAKSRRTARCPEAGYHEQAEVGQAGADVAGERHHQHQGIQRQVRVVRQAVLQRRAGTAGRRGPRSRETIRGISSRPTSRPSTQCRLSTGRRCGWSWPSTQMTK